MKKVFLSLLAVLTFLLHPAYARQAQEQQHTQNLSHAFNQLYDCSQKLHRASYGYNIDYDLEYLEDDLFYILDRHTPALYLFTPFFAGDADLSHIIKTEIQRVLDAHKINKQNPFPLTPCCQGGFSYNIRIPYSSGAFSRPGGYFYITINDSTAMMYDEVYWDKSEKKMHVIRHDEPFMKAGPHDARINGIARFLPGPPQAMPDFTNYTPGQAENGVTVTSVTGQTDRGVEYRPLDIEKKLWDKNAPGNFSPKARDLLISDIASRLRAIPREHKVGQRADCWGHAGCDYTYSEAEVAQEHKTNMEALNSCKAAADELHLDIFPTQTP